MVLGKFRLISSFATILSLLPPAFDGLGTRLGVSRFQVPLIRCRRPGMSRRFRMRGFRHLGLGPVPSGRFDMRFLCRGLVNLIPFFRPLSLAFLSAFWVSLAPLSLRGWRRFLRIRLELFRVIAVTLVRPQLLD